MYSGCTSLQQANLREVGLLFYVASAADDIGDALALLARYCCIVNLANTNG